MWKHLQHGVRLCLISREPSNRVGTHPLYIGVAESVQSGDAEHVVTAVAVAAMVLPESGTVNNITVGSATGAVDTHVSLYSPFDTGSHVGVAESVQFAGEEHVVTTAGRFAACSLS